MIARMSSTTTPPLLSVGEAAEALGRLQDRRAQDD
jgi:hypothetical protein